MFYTSYMLWNHCWKICVHFPPTKIIIKYELFMNMASLVNIMHLVIHHKLAVPEEPEKLTKTNYPFPRPLSKFKHSIFQFSSITFHRKKFLHSFLQLCVERSFLHPSVATKKNTWWGQQLFFNPTKYGPN